MLRFVYLLVTIDDCAFEICQNGGSCEDHDRFTCICARGYSGKYCQSRVWPRYNIAKKRKFARGHAKNTQIVLFYYLSKKTPTYFVLDLKIFICCMLRYLSTLWAPYQADFGTNTEIQYFSVFAVYVKHKFNTYFGICAHKRVIKIKPNSPWYCWTDSPCLKRWRTRLAGSSITV